MMATPNYNSDLTVVTSGDSADKPSPLSPLCGWQKLETSSPNNSPKKKSPLTPVKRRQKPDDWSAGQTSLLAHRELLPMCCSSDNSTAKTDADITSINSHNTVQDDVMYFKVPDLKFSDLYDWSVNSSPTCRHVTTVNPRRGLAVSKPSGSTVEVNSECIALFRYQKSLFAINEECPHQKGPLHLGDIEVLPESVCIVCPWHKWKIDLSSGEILSPANRDRKARVYPTQLDDDDSIWIGFDTYSAACFNLFTD